MLSLLKNLFELCVKQFLEVLVLTKITMIQYNKNINLIIFVSVWIVTIFKYVSKFKICYLEIKNVLEINLISVTVDMFAIYEYVVIY